MTRLSDFLASRGPADSFIEIAEQLEFTALWKGWLYQKCCKIIRCLYQREEAHLATKIVPFLSESLQRSLQNRNFLFKCARWSM